MNAITINDLELNNALDSHAMAKILGGGRVAYEYTGSSIGSMSAWRYTGRYFKSFVGNSYLSGHGWTKKYRTGYQYKREQFKMNYFNEFYK